MAIILALNYGAELEPDKYLLCMDCLNAMIWIEKLIVKNILVQRIQELCHKEIERGVEVSTTARYPCCRYLVIWACAVNDLDDQAGKNSAGRPQEFIPIPYRDWIFNIKRRMYELWELSWREERWDFYLLKPKTGYWSEDTRKRMRRDEVVINRLCLGHTRLTHGFIFDESMRAVRITESPTTVWTVQWVCC